MGAPPQPQVKALYCPNCGAPLTIRALQHTITVACPNCLSVLDAKDPNLAVLQKAQEQQRCQPAIPLGARGKVRGDPYEVIGFQVRTIYADGKPYSWSEYLLFNPFKGFRYLTEYQGHWNDVTVLRSLPEVDTSGKRPRAKLLGEMFRHFQTAEAETTYVMGEFPWQVRVGERVNVMDFVSPPRMLSREATPSEVTWSLGEYLPGARVWEMFKLPGKPPRAVGVFENQPSPLRGSVSQIWLLCVLLLASLYALEQAAETFCASRPVLQHIYSFSPRTPGEASFVTEGFELKGRPSSVELTTQTDLANNWVYFNFALIDSETGQAFDFGREVSYYYGRDSDGAWSEGDRNDRVLIPTVPAGRYYLRVEPEMDPNAAPVRYRITLRRDVPAMSFFWIAALLLVVPPAFLSIRAISFEQSRWQESDYASSAAAAGGHDN